jgi:hypothetical protein
MGSILCGLQSRDQHCNIRNETGSETAVEQLSQQVMIASPTIAMELCDGYSTPYDSQDRQKVQEILCDYIVDDENKDIVISEIATRAITGKAEFAFLGEEFTSTEEIKLVTCDGGATSTLSSSFENGKDCQQRIEHRRRYIGDTDSALESRMINHKVTLLSIGNLSCMAIQANWVITRSLLFFLTR